MTKNSTKTIGRYYDMHIHSRNSHDSEALVSDMAKVALEKGLAGFAITDHCDIEYCETIDLDEVISGSFTDALSVDCGLEILRGVEIGEAFWYPSVSERIISSYDFDVIIGSVHAVKFNEYQMPYSLIDFSLMSTETVKAYLNKYFDDMLYTIETCDFDILAHLTCPLRYINGKYNHNISCDEFNEKIDKVLKEIIEREIALEVNTSCVYDGSNYCEFLPEKTIIERYKQLGGYLITTGSDAHVACNCANNFEQLYATLKNIGFEKVYYYKKRMAIACEII